MKRCGILGGTFNPIHLAHLYIAYEAKEQLKLDTVIFMPAGNPPHKKNNNILDSDIRYDMVKKAIENYDGFEISDYEIRKSGFSYTYETVRDFKKDDLELFFIAGGDSLLDIEKWVKPEDIFNKCNLVVFNRGKLDLQELNKQKDKLEKKYDANIILLDVVDIDISSSMIRERIQEGKKVDFFLPKNIVDYIKKQNLYREK